MKTSVENAGSENTLRDEADISVCADRLASFHTQFVNVDSARASSPNKEDEFTRSRKQSHAYHEQSCKYASSNQCRNQLLSVRIKCS